MKRGFFTWAGENIYRYWRDKRIIARITRLSLSLSSSWLDPCLDFYVPESDVKAISGAELRGGKKEKKRSRAIEKKAALSPL